MQLAQLPRLQRLKLCECGYSADSLSPLSALAGSLTRLEVSGTWLPAASLAALTRLQQLHFDICRWPAVLATAAALPHLTGLTCLVRAPEVVGLG